MDIGVDKLSVLRLRAKESFEAAIFMGAKNAEGVAILTAQNIILTGRTTSKLDAASDALRGPANADLSILAAVVFSPSKEIQPETLAELKKCSPASGGAHIYHAEYHGKPFQSADVRIKEVIPF
jgi:hypothetical protein